MTSAMDMLVVEEYLDLAQLHGSRNNQWAEGYWIGRAVQHAHQNSVDYDLIKEWMDARGLDSAVLEVPKGDEVDPRLN